MLLVVVGDLDVEAVEGANHAAFSKVPRGDYK